MRALCAFAAAAALVLAACGDDDEADAPQPDRLGSTEAASARQVCAATVVRARKVLGADSIPDFERYGREAGAVVTDLRRELDAIDAGEVAAWGNWLVAIDADLAAYRKLELAGSVANREAVLEQFAKVQKARPGRIARTLGLPVCAEATDRAAKTFSTP